MSSVITIKADAGLPVRIDYLKAGEVSHHKFVRPHTTFVEHLTSELSFRVVEMQTGDSAIPQAENDSRWVGQAEELAEHKSDAA